MGVEYWLLFRSPKEARRAETYLKPLSATTMLPGSWLAPHWLTWTGAMRLEIGGSAGHQPSVLDFLRREVCRRFDVRRIGADSVGWYPDADFKYTGERCAGALYPGYTSWSTWAKDYKPEWSHYLPKRKYWPEETYEREYARCLAILRRTEQRVVDLFVELDAGRPITGVIADD